MMRRCIVHVLLSLLLLASQQMAFAHAMSHWTGRLVYAPVAAGEDRELAKALAQDQTCNQCLALAQLATPVGSSLRQFVASDLRTELAASNAMREAAPRTVCAFDSRAPPSFV
ncbi:MULTISPECIES: hypothetical protein [Massilia]|uniref:DUF2946 domain-containing protein n=1 Tax=Massilia haematophila TaxID=457923 RepID=A0ABV7PGP6_9BURK|nr:hypothetical protein [Massilia sp.]